MRDEAAGPNEHEDGKRGCRVEEPYKVAQRTVVQPTLGGMKVRRMVHVVGTQHAVVFGISLLRMYMHGGQEKRRHIDCQ